MTAQYTITTEIVHSPDDHWIASRKTETFDENLKAVETSEVLTGEKAFAYKALEILKRYEAFLESQKQSRIDLAKRLLTVEVN